MALSALKDLTAELETLFTAAWRAIRRLAVVWRAEPHRSVAPPATVDAVDAAAPLPPRRTRLALMPVGPYMLHAYWRISGPDLAEADRQLQGERPRAVLRLHETSAGADSAAAGGAFDVEVHLAAGNWYVPLWTAGRTYRPEIGFRTNSGEFVALARGNTVQTPPAWPAAAGEERFVRITGEERRIEPVETPELPKAGRWLPGKGAVFPPHRPDTPGRQADGDAAEPDAPDMTAAIENEFLPGFFSGIVHGTER